MDIINYILKLIQAYLNKTERLEPVKSVTLGGFLKGIDIERQYITLNRYSRPGKKLKRVKGIVIHWTGVPRQNCRAVRSWFEQKKEGKHGYSSAHFCVKNNKIVQMIPENEIAYHVGSRKYSTGIQKKLSKYPNDCTLGIECCIENKEGKMSQFTMTTLKKLVSHLCLDHDLEASDLYLHRDVTGKMCHMWFVKYPDEWLKFRKSINKIWG